MEEEEEKQFCRHCWNPVERIKYAADGVRTYGGVENVWKHSPGGFAYCSTNPITDEDVIPESELP